MAQDDWLVMVIDDDDMFREEIREMLESTGLRVVEFSSGLEWVESLEALDPDLVITDIQMPEMDGIEVVRHLRAHRPDIPVIAVSGGDSRGYVGNLEAAQLLGANYVMPKPVDAGLLVTTAFDLIEESAAA